MRVTDTRQLVTLEADIDLDGPGLVYRHGQASYRAWSVRVTLKGATRAEALADDMPHVAVVTGYRIKADGTRGTQAGLYHSLSWHNTAKEDYVALMGSALAALAGGTA